MSIKVITAVWETTLEATELLVMLALADWADDDAGRIYPSRKRIAWKVRISPRSVQRMLGEFRDRGYIEVVAEAGYRLPTEYRIRLDIIPRKESFEEFLMGDKLAPIDDDRRETPGVEKGDTAVEPARETTSATMGDTAMEHKPSRESTKIKPSKEPPTRAQGEDDGFAAFWAEWPRDAEGGRPGKAAAKVKYARALKFASADVLLAGLRFYASTRDVRRGFVKHAATWLNQRGWEDAEEAATSAGATSSYQAELDEIARRDTGAS